jgi:hypothetical protein
VVTMWGRSARSVVSESREHSIAEHVAMRRLALARAPPLPPPHTHCTCARQALALASPRSRARREAQDSKQLDSSPHKLLMWQLKSGPLQAPCPRCTPLTAPPPHQSRRGPACPRR